MFVYIKRLDEQNASRVFDLRQMVKYGFENFMHKKKGWNRLSDDEKAEYRALHDEFIARSGEMLKEYEKSGSKELENKLIKYLSETDNFRNTLENKG